MTGAGADSSPTLTERFRSARTDRELAVLEGFHAVKHAVRFGAEVLEAASDDPGGVEALARKLAPDLVPWLRGAVRTLDRATFEALAPPPPPTRLLALARRPRQHTEALADRSSPVVLLESPRHPGNLGAAVRVAAAAGARAVLTLGGDDPWRPAALRGSAGLHFALPVVAVEDPPEGLGPLVAVHVRGRPLAPGRIPAGAVLAFGSERHGLGAGLLERAEARLRIPTRPGVSSLNLATAVAVVLYAWRLGGSDRSVVHRSP